MNTHPFRMSSNCAKNPLDLIHNDLHDPFKTPTHSGYQYWIIFIDDNIQYCVVCFLCTKDQAFKAFKIYKVKVEDHWNWKTKTILNEQGGEYMSKTFLGFTDECGIEHLHTV